LLTALNTVCPISRQSKIDNLNLCGMMLSDSSV